MRRVILILFHLLLVITPFAFTSINDELFEFNKMMVVYAFTILITGAWLWRMVEEKRRIFPTHLLIFPLALFLLSQGLSTVFSLHPNTSIFGYYSRFHGGLLSSVSYTILTLAAVANLTRRDLPGLTRSLLFAGTGVALYAIPEHFGVSPSCVLITHEVTAKCWVQDVQTRVFATFGQPNWLAAYFLMLIPLIPWQLRQESFRNAFWRWWPFASLILMTLALLYTRSRSGFLALGLVVGTYLLLAVGRSVSMKKVSLADLRLPLLVGLIVLLFGSPFSPPLSQRIQRVLPTQSQPEQQTASTAPATPTGGTALETGGTDSGKIREVVWKGALAVWQRYPLLGSGVETFAYSYYRDRPAEHNLNSEWDFLYNRAHNEYLNALATTGFLGLSALLLLQLTSLTLLGRLTLRAWREKDESALWLGLGGGAAYAAAAATNFFGFSTVMIGVLMFLLPALALVYERNPQESSEPQKRALTTKVRRVGDEVEVNVDGNLLAGGAIALIGVVALYAVWSMWNNDRLLARAKQQLAEGQALKAYEIYETLTRRAPQEAVFWNEKSLTLAQISSAVAKEDATMAAKLAKQAIAASDTTVQRNPVQLNFWKSRARVFLILSLQSDAYLTPALDALRQAQMLAPTDAKVVYNQALILDSLNKPQEAEIAYQRAIDLKSNYEEARQSYARFLERIGALEAARDQYQYVIEHLNPGDDVTRQHLEELSASISAKKV